MTRVIILTNLRDKLTKIAVDILDCQLYASARLRYTRLVSRRVWWAELIGRNRARWACRYIDVCLDRNLIVNMSVRKAASHAIVAWGERLMMHLKIYVGRSDSASNLFILISRTRIALNRSSLFSGRLTICFVLYGYTDQEDWNADCASQPRFVLLFSRWP